jgi:hypothetical protein
MWARDHEGDFLAGEREGVAFLADDFLGEHGSLSFFLSSFGGA